MDMNRFVHARKGDMLCAQFQCDRCWFLNLKKREPSPDIINDNILLGYIRRVNLDILWSKEPSTIYANYLNAIKKKKRSEELTLPPIATARGPWPIADNQGFQVALEMIKQSQFPGRNSETYQQFDSIRKLRGASFNEYESGRFAMDDFVMAGDGGRTFRTNLAPTQSRLFCKFIRGCEKRMGRLVIQNKALDIRILQKMLMDYDFELLSKRTSEKRRRMVTMLMAYFTISFVGALRGSEGLMLEATSLCRYISKGDVKGQSEAPHVLIPLMGRFKNELGERNVMLPMTNETASGIQVRKTMENLARVLKIEGRSEGMPGPALCHSNGRSISRAEINREFLVALSKIQATNPEMIGEEIEIEKSYHIYRSLRRGATSRAASAGLKGPEIERNNRWRKYELNGGSMPNMSMLDLYTDIKLALSSYLLFSSSL